MNEKGHSSFVSFIFRLSVPSPIALLPAKSMSLILYFGPSTMLNVTCTVLA